MCECWGPCRYKGASGSSAVCAFTMAQVERAFSSRYREVNRETQQWYTYNHPVPEPRPGAVSSVQLGLGLSSKLFKTTGVHVFFSNFPHSVWLTRPGTWASIRLCTCRIKCLTSSRTTSWWTAWSAVLPCCWNAACATRRLPCTRSKAWRGHTMCCSSGQVAHLSQQRLNAHPCGRHYHSSLLSSQPCRRGETP